MMALPEAKERGGERGEKEKERARERKKERESKEVRMKEKVERLFECAVLLVSV